MQITMYVLDWRACDGYRADHIQHWSTGHIFFNGRMVTRQKAAAILKHWRRYVRRMGSDDKAQLTRSIF